MVRDEGGRVGGVGRVVGVTATSVSIGTFPKLQLGQVSGGAHRNKGERSELTLGDHGTRGG